MSIEKEMGEERNELENMPVGEAIKESLAEELDQEASKNTPFLKSVNASKKEFDQALSRLSTIQGASGSTKEIPSVISVKRKRNLEEMEAGAAGTAREDKVGVAGAGKGKKKQRRE